MYNIEADNVCYGVRVCVCVSESVSVSVVCVAHQHAMSKMMADPAGAANLNAAWWPAAARHQPAERRAQRRQQAEGVRQGGERTIDGDGELNPALGLALAVSELPATPEAKIPTDPVSVCCRTAWQPCVST